MCITDVPVEMLRELETDRRLYIELKAWRDGRRSERHVCPGYEGLLQMIRDIRAEVAASWPSPSAVALYGTIGRY